MKRKEFLYWDIGHQSQLIVEHVVESVAIHLFTAK